VSMFSIDLTGGFCTSRSEREFMSLTGIYSLCQITAHVGPDHLLSRTILRLPFIRRLLVP